MKDFHWSRATVTSGSMFGKIIIGPLFGFVAGWFIDRFGPRRLMLSGILMCGLAVIGLSRMTSLWEFYSLYLLMALGLYVRRAIAESGVNLTVVRQIPG